MELGYWLSSEEHRPRDLVANARRAEDAGFEFAVVSDHFHPWIDTQGQSPFVWSTIGGIAQATERIRLGTGVTCPLIRLHPAIVAQAAATAAAMMPGRFFLGLGSGENLNEHVTGAKWPVPDERLEMLEEAIDLLRELWEGALTTRRGRHYLVERARIYTLPNRPPPIVVAAAQANAARLAGRKGDAFMNTSPDEEIVREYEQAGGTGARYGKVTGVLADDEEEATRIALELWPNIALGGSLGQELALPSDFEAAVATVRPEDVEQPLALGSDPQAWRVKIREFEQAGFTHVALHNVGPGQERFIEFARHELLGA